MPAADFSYFRSSDGRLVVATIDLATGAISGVSAPVPPGAVPWAPGTKMSDGRYVFVDTSLGDPVFAVQVLSADRGTWTQVATDNDQSNINDNAFSVVPTGDTEVTVFHRAVSPVRRCKSFVVDIDTGVTSRFVLWPNNTDDEVYYYEAASLIRGTTLALATTESEYIYLVDAGAVTLPYAGGVWLNLADRDGADLDLTAAVYSAARSSVVVAAVAPFGAHSYVREYSYPDAALVNEWGPFTSAAIGFDSNGCIAGTYYGLGGAATIGAFSLEAGLLTDYAVPGALTVVRMIVGAAPAPPPGPNGDPKIDLAVVALARAAVTVQPRVSTEPEPLP